MGIGGKGKSGGEEKREIRREWEDRIKVEEKREGKSENGKEGIPTMKSWIRHCKQRCENIYSTYKIHALSLNCCEKVIKVLLIVSRFNGIRMLTVLMQASGSVHKLRVPHCEERDSLGIRRSL